MVEQEKGKWYFINGFLLNDYNMLLDILKCFCTKNSKILFKHYFFKMEHMEEELKMDMVEDDFKGFCKGVNLEKGSELRVVIENKVKDILYNNFKELKVCNTSVEIDKDELFNKLCKGELSDVNGAILQRIKEYVSKSISEYVRPEVETFINSRKVLINSEDISFRKTSINKPIEYVWYMPNNDCEIIKALEIEGFFECIITEEKDIFRNYSYAFKYFERNDMVLAVNDRQGDYLQRISPNIEKLLENRYTIDDEKTFYGKY